MPSLRFPKIAAVLAAGWLAAVIVPVCVDAQSTQPGSVQILPNSFGAFTATSRRAFTPGSGAAANGTSGAQTDVAAQSAREYGYDSGETVVYSAGSAGAPATTLTATLYKMKDPTGGYGEYSYLRTPEMVAADFTEHSSIKPDEALVLLGNLVLDVQGAGTQHNGTDIKTLVAAVAPKAESGALPTLPDRLPVDKRIAKTDHYILGPQTLDQFFPGGIGNTLGFAYGTEAETAHFKLGKDDATLLIADFPTPQIAQSQLDTLSKRFNVNGSQPATASPVFYAVRNQTLLAIVAGVASQGDANQLLDQVKSGTVLTWSEPTFQFKEPSIEVMILGAFLGTGTICLITLVGALAFSGFRLMVKRKFPNTVFDRNSQIDILQMGLVSKPIKAEDFYTFDGKKIEENKANKNLPDRTALRLFK